VQDPILSIACWKEHKKSECTPVTANKKVEVDTEATLDTALYNYPTEDTVPLEKLRQLEHNQELKNILCNRHLRDMLIAIDKSANPAAAMRQAMLEPIFVEFADECLKVVEPASE